MVAFYCIFTENCFIFFSLSINAIKCDSWFDERARTKRDVNIEKLENFKWKQNGRFIRQLSIGQIDGNCLRLLFCNFISDERNRKLNFLYKLILLHIEDFILSVFVVAEQQPRTIDIFLLTNKYIVESLQRYFPVSGIRRYSSEQHVERGSIESLVPVPLMRNSKSFFVFYHFISVVAHRSSLIINIAVDGTGIQIYIVHLCSLLRQLNSHVARMSVVNGWINGLLLSTHFSRHITINQTALIRTPTTTQRRPSINHALAQYLIFPFCE